MMATASQLHQYCLDHGFTLIQHTQGKISHMPTINWWTVGFWALCVVGAYELGRITIPTFVSDVKSLWTKFTGLFSGTQTTTTPVATPSNPA